MAGARPRKEKRGDKVLGQLTGQQLEEGGDVGDLRVGARSARVDVAQV